MKSITIKIVVIGHLRHQLDLRMIKRFKSQFFKIGVVEKINTLPTPNKEDGFLDVAYSREEIESLLSNVNSAEIVVGIMNYRFDDNFYMHRTGSNKVCISIAKIDGLLLENNISLENFIIKNLFEIIVLKNAFGDVINDDIYNLVHQDTRGCLFDLNGDKYDVLYNTEKPIICDSCKAFFNGKSLPANFIKNIEAELKRIRKPLICTIELFIKKYPFFSVSLALLTSIVVNLISNVIWEFLK